MGELDDARAADAAEHEVLYAATLAFADAPQNGCGERGGRPAISRHVVIARALEWIRGHHDEPVHVAALCTPRAFEGGCSARPVKADRDTAAETVSGRNSLHR